jgi:hypothetical protein
MLSSTIRRFAMTLDRLDLAVGQRELLKRKLQQAEYQKDRKKAKEIMAVAVRFSQPVSQAS